VHLIDFQVIRLWKDGNVLLPDACKFHVYCNVVSRKKLEYEELEPCKNEELQKSLDLLRAILPDDFEWPHREGLYYALHRASRAWLTNTMVDVTTHLADRMVRWIVIRLDAVIDQAGITGEHLRTIAQHIVSTLTWDEEKKEVAQALKAGKRPRRPPDYERPNGIDELLGAAVLEKLPDLNQETKDHIWRLFDVELLAKIGGPLPLCSSNFGNKCFDKRYGSLAVASHQDGGD
jgi:hypothetical protein